MSSYPADASPPQPQHSLEEEIRRYFRSRGISYADHARGPDRFARLDFSFGTRAEKRLFTFDAKEKRQRYQPGHWPENAIPEEHLFILDDLAARKVLAFAPNSGLLVRDNLRPAYYLFTIVDLFLMPKQRANRPIGKTLVKGKWMIDLRNGQRFATLEEAFTGIAAYLDARESIFSQVLACYGAYVGEEIDAGGVVRQARHWRVDVQQTR